MSRCKPCLEQRREFIAAALSTAVGTALPASVVASVGALISSCGKKEDNASSSAGVVIPISSTGIYTLDFATYSQLQTAGGSLAATVQAQSGNKAVYIIRVSSTVATTISQTCTHASCTVGTYNSSSQTLTCPCHSSVFQPSGAVVSGPATTALTSYVTTIAASSIQVTIP